MDSMTESAGLPSPTRSAPPIRVAFLWPFGERSQRELSGMPWAMEHALRETGLNVVPIVGPKPRTVLPHAAVEVICGHGAVRKQMKRLRQRANRLRDEIVPTAAVKRHVTKGRERVSEIDRAIHAADVDVVFGCCVSRVLGALTTRLPIVYFSDTTARLITTTYPVYMRRSRAYKRACDSLEQTALDRADFTCFATEVARRSAIDLYGVEPRRAFVAPMGANITPVDLDREGASIERPPPSRKSLRLCVVASDPERKRVDFCVDVVEALRDRGWKATMRLIGTPTARSRSSSFVEYVGRLDHTSPADRARQAAEYAASHVLLLTSTGEAFGIAPCEAAAFGVPSIVSDAGGLPEVVQHEQTGVVLPISSSKFDYANAIEALVDDPVRHNTMGEAARRRAANTLNWSRWSESVANIICNSVSQASTPEITIASAIRKRSLAPR